MKGHVHIDIETFSEVDLVKDKSGVYKYAKHPSTEIMLISFSLNNDPVIDIDMTRFARADQANLKIFTQLVNDSQLIKWAHNAQFETTLFEHASNSPLKNTIKFREWRCTMVLGHACSLLGALKHVGEVLRLPADTQKMKEGRRLIQKFCKLRTPTANKPHTRCDRFTDPDDWATFIKYCHIDVEAERQVHKRLKRWDMPEHEWDLYFLDQEINRRGMPVDIELVNAAIREGDLASTQTKQDIIKRFGLDVGKPIKVGEYLKSKGFDIPDCTKDTLNKLLDRDDLEDEVRYIIAARLDTNKASIKKFHALQKATESDNRVRGCYQFAGASRTWRWAGRIFQPQNLARGSLQPHQIPDAKRVVKSGDHWLMNFCYGGVNEVLPSLVRSAITAPAGKKIVVADLASIETIMLAWAAGSEHMLKLFSDGLDPYKDYATHLYNIEYQDVTKAQRTYAKPPTLGCGFMLGAFGLVAYADGYGVRLTEKEAKKQVDVYRDAYPDVVTFWHDLDRAARLCIKTHKPQTVNHFTFTFDKPFMRVSLPSGRSLSYLRPRIEMRPAPWDKAKLIPNVCYEGVDQNASGSNKWKRISTHAGKITENIVQAIARDVLVAGLVNADADEGLEVIGHVHDEIICLADEDDNTALDRLIGHMTTLPTWCRDIPINAEGFESNFYMKD